MIATRSLADAKAHLSECVSSAEAGHPVLITRHGKLAAAVIGPEDWQRFQRQSIGPRRGLLAVLRDYPDGDAWADEMDRIVASRTSGRSVPDPD